MADVTGIVATYNEEEYIEGCLRTLAWCDETIVVDDGSTDATVEIASEVADRVIESGSDDYHAAPVYQVGIDAAEHEYIYMLAADEMVPPAAAERLRAIVDEERADVAVVGYKNYLFGQWMNGAGWQPWGKPRLFRPDYIRFPDNINEVHAEIEPTEDARVVELPDKERFLINHFTYLDLGDFVDRSNRYTSVEAEYELDFAYHRLLLAPVWEFFHRLIVMKGYRLGWRGLLLSILMSGYTLLGYLKCWEREYWGTAEDYADEYERVRQSLLNEWDRASGRS